VTVIPFIDRKRGRRKRFMLMEGQPIDEPEIENEKRCRYLGPFGCNRRKRST
jgi:hypothetical protein